MEEIRSDVGALPAERSGDLRVPGLDRDTARTASAFVLSLAGVESRFGKNGRPSSTVTKPARQTATDEKLLVVAIDGPAGAGKSTVARLLAKTLGVSYIDTGAMYRAVGLLALRQGLTPPFDDQDVQERLGRLARDHTIDLDPSGETVRVLLDGEDVSEAIRSPEAAAMASAVSAVSAVRRAVVPIQRRLAELRGGVLEGRDIGSVVCPDADLKIFLTAAPEERARRRFEELRVKGVPTTLEDVREEQAQRDLQDTSRDDSPLQVAQGAVVLDSSSMSAAAVVEWILDRLARIGTDRLTQGRAEP